MKLIHLETGRQKHAVVELVTESDYKGITKSKYFFDWKTEKGNIVYKLRLPEDKEILGLMSLIQLDQEKRLEIKLLCVSKENRGNTKKYDGIAANLIAYACREAVRLYAESACVSLVPKDELVSHYIKKYGMQIGGYQLFLEGLPLYQQIKKCGL